MKSLSIAVLTSALWAGSAFAAEPAKKPAEPAKPAETAEKAPEFTVVTASGEADVRDGQEADAKQRARDIALREAVNKVVGTTVTASSEMADFTLVRDLVFSQTTGYVRKYDIIDTKSEEGVVTVTVKAEVAKAAIDKDAAAIATLIGMKKQKRVYVMVNDVSVEGVAGSNNNAIAANRHGMFDAMLREQLRKDGFITLDPNLVDGKLKSKAAVQSLNTPQEASEIGNAVGADVIIYGQATAMHADADLMGIKMASATVRMSLTAVSPDSGEVLADYAESKSMTDHTPPNALGKAMKAGAEAAMKEIRKGFFQAWRKQAMNGQNVAMSVTGLKDYGTLNMFKSLLTNQVRGVKDISSVRFDKGNASMDLMLVGTPESLASELSGKTFKGMTVNVNKVTNNAIEVSLSK